MAVRRSTRRNPPPEPEPQASSLQSQFDQFVQTIAATRRRRDFSRQERVAYYELLVELGYRAYVEPDLPPPPPPPPSPARGRRRRA